MSATRVFRTDAARRAAAKYGAAELIAKAVDELPELTPAQIEALRLALPPVPQEERQQPRSA